MTIIVYSRPSCSPCATLKYWLNKNQIEYTELAPDNTITMVPTILVDGERVVGLNLQRLKELLGLASS